jgi:excisionase family DNA binding protein
MELADLLTTKEIARYLKLRSETVLRKVKNGEIPAIKMGGRFRFDKNQIDEWLSHSSTARKRILVVDDEPVIGQLFERSLDGYGCEVITVQNGQEALDLLASEHFDLIFLDLVMPGIDGSELFSRISAIDRHTPVAIVTGHAYGDLINKAMEQGPFLVMRKPIEGADIRKAVLGFTQGMLTKSEDKDDALL